MLSPVILIPAILNGLLTGAVYALVALGLTLIYGVLHIINFAHGAMLTAAMFAAYLRVQGPWASIRIWRFSCIAPLFFAFGYALQRFVIGPASHGDDRNMLLVTLGLAIVIENALLYAFRGDTRTIDLPYAFQTIDLGFTFLAVPRRGRASARCSSSRWCSGLIMNLTDTGKAIRAVAKEKLGAQLAGIDVAHVYAVTFGLGTACVAIAACLLMPTYLRQSERRRCLRAGRLHHRRAWRHGLGARRADRRSGRSAWSKACPACFSASRSARSAFS